MHLMKLFNLRYLFQNLKKSKAAVALFMGLIPLLNTIMFLVMIIDNNGDYIPSFSDISYITIAGMYILPIVLAVTLLGYTFKKSSTDFVGSLPLSRKTIYFTNVIGGILVILFVILLNVILMIITKSFYPNVFISGYMLWDYFILWITAYIFVFVAACLAMSSTGNAITGIVVTALIIFLIPFMHDYAFNMADYSKSEVVCSDTNCISDLNYDESTNYDVYISKQKENNYTLPYKLVSQGILSYDNNQSIYNTNSIIKMVITNIIYFGIGLYAFSRKKLEISETSFRSIHVHYVVKCLTLIPFGILFYTLYRNGMNFIGSMFFLALILAYYFIYDLITKKSISKIRLSLLYFLALAMFIWGYCSISQIIYSEVNTIELNNDTIVKVNIEFPEISETNSQAQKVFVSNKDLISLIIKTYQNNTNNGFIETDGDETSEYQSVTVTVQDENNAKYSMWLTISLDDYNQMKEIFIDSNEFKNYFASIDYDKYLAISLGNTVLTGSDKNETINILKETLKNIDSSYYSDIKSYSGYNDFIKIYTYDNHRLSEYSINAHLDNTLLDLAVKINHRNLNNIIENNDRLFLNISYAYLGEEYDDTFYFYYDEIKNMIFDYIDEHINDNIDISKEYVFFSINYEMKEYKFFTNNVEEFLTLYDVKVQEVKNKYEIDDGVTGEKGV